jgi:hypothetical protein
MAADDDVPLGAGAQQYYERKFDDRIKDISKAPRTPSRSSEPSSSGNSSGNSAGRVVGYIVVVIVVAFLRVGCRDSSSRSSRQPTVPQFQFDQNRFDNTPRDRQRKQWEDPWKVPANPPVFQPEGNQDDAMKRVDDLIREMQKKNKGEVPPPPPRNP